MNGVEWVHQVSQEEVHFLTSDQFSHSLLPVLGSLVWMWAPVASATLGTGSPFCRRRHRAEVLDWQRHCSTCGVGTNTARFVQHCIQPISPAEIYLLNFFWSQVAMLLQCVVKMCILVVSQVCRWPLFGFSENYTKGRILAFKSLHSKTSVNLCDCIGWA